MNFVPDYLKTPEHSSAKIWGTLKKYDGKWIVEGHPYMISLAKRLFPGSKGNGHGSASFPASKRIVGDISWFMQRFPLTVKDKKSWLEDLAEAQDHFKVQESMLKKPKKVLPSPKFEGELKEFQKEGLAFLLHNPRSLLADEMGLGKCMCKENTVYDTKTGTRYLELPIGKEITIPNHSNGTINSCKTEFNLNGEKLCIELILGDGRKLHVSTDHPIYAGRKGESGPRFIPASELDKECAVAVIRKLPKPSSFSNVTVDEAKIVALLHADGSLSQKTVQYTKLGVHPLELKKLLKRIDGEIRPRKSKLNNEYSISIPKDFRERFQLHALSKNKKIPDSILHGTEKVISSYLNYFIGSDGFVGKSNYGIEVTLASKELIRDIEFLLHRLGIRATRYPEKIARYTYNGEKRTSKAYRLMITGQYDLRLFFEKVGIPLGREEQVNHMIKHWAKKPNSNVDIVPLNRVGIRKLGLHGKVTPDKWWIGRGKFSELCEKNNYYGDLSWLASDAIRWEKVLSVKSIGKHAVYDFSAPPEATGVVNGIVVHNTPTAIAWLTSLKCSPPYLVVVPPHILIQWKSEIKKFLGEETSVHIIKGLKPYSLPASEVYLIHYLLLRGWKNYLPKFGFSACVFDEIQELRHATSDKYSAASLLSDSVKYLIGLSGTFFYNYGSEAWNVINILDFHCLGDFDSFSREWCTGYGSKLIKDPKLLGEYLREEGLFLRRKMEDVLSELPPKRRIIQNIDVDEGKYDELIAPIIDQAKRISDIKDAFERGRETMMTIDSTRMITGIAKAHYVCAFVKTLMEAGETVILYGHHHAVMDIYMEELKDSYPVMISGRQNSKTKDEAQKAFMGGDTDLIIISLRSATGLNLQRARCVVFGELDWSPAILSQGEGRAYRIGTKDSVLCYYLTCNAGTDQAMLETLGLKTSQFVGIMGDKEETEHDKLMAQVDTKKHMKQVIELLQKGGRKKEISDEKTIEKLRKLEKLPSSKEPTSLSDFYARQEEYD